ncbi:MAG: helix-turn-helix domain-containing protein [Litorimonas sp.]
MLILDVLLRYSTVTMLFLIAILSIRDGRKFPPKIFIVLATVAIAFMLLGTSLDEFRLPQPFHAIVRFGDVANIVFIWWLGLAIFQDDFRLRWPHWAVLILNCVILLPHRFRELQGEGYFHQGLNIGLDLVMVGIMGHLVFVTLKGRADDLIEPRRRLRLYFVLGMVLATLSAMLVENLLTNSHPEFLQTLRCIIIFPLALWAILWLTEMHPEKITFTDASKPIESGSVIDPRDKALLDNLNAAMNVEKIFTEPGLTIRILSEKLKTPEHRLRHLINSGLGYRNFSSFLNYYRVEAIKSAFAKPENSRIPVLTIALDHGYNSLAPFNRAFRNLEGITPSAYRRKIEF